MQKLYVSPTPFTPEIHLSPDENIFIISGTSSPEDVRALYYPVIEYIRTLVDNILLNKNNIYSHENPLKFQVDLDYFNSSSAKFLYDIFMELNKLSQSEIPVIIEWYHDVEDIDMKEAGSDIAFLAEMEFTFIPKPK